MEILKEPLSVIKDAALWLIACSVVIEAVPIKINPCSWLAKWFGKRVNGSIMAKLNNVDEALNEHICVDDEHNADLHRVYILQFNRELLRGIPHTMEDSVEALAEIDFYERYCAEHPEYENKRVVLAIQNIKRAYNEELENNGFCKV